MKTVLRISDGQHKFPFLYDGNYLYCPDYNPLVYGKRPQYCLTIKCGGPHGFEFNLIFDSSEFLPCKPFRHEGHNYQQAKYVGLAKDWFVQYLTLQAWKNATNVGEEDYILGGGEADPDYTSVQAAHIADMPPFAISVVTNKFGICIPGVIAELENYFRSCYAYDDSKVEVRAQVAVIDENDIYWQSSTMSPVEGYDMRFELTGWPFISNQQWKDDLRIVGILNVSVEHPYKDENDEPYCINIDVRSNPFQLTETIFAQLLCTAQGYSKITDLKNMNVNKPRVINKNIMQVVEMTAQTDSKSNIVQPVFFRTRELANLILHPEVTENVCVNLDAYKAQCSRFFIKVEGTTFPEIGRTESGIIFKVQGNLLPGRVAGGVYYILNQDLDLVTTGKYTYEA